MKEPIQWEESELLALIANQREEDATLDFKRADSLENTDKRKDEISKDVSAFANSAGGMILYGMEESPDPPHYAKALSPIDPNKSSKEWLEQVINSRVKPRLEGMVVRPIELKKTHDGRFAYLVLVPEGATAYQASDKRYYRRYNFESVPMEDYEVRSVMNRGSRPFYTLKLEAGQVSSHGGSIEFRFRCIVQNESETVGRDVSAVIFVPEKLVRQPDEFRTSIDGLSYARIPANYVESTSVHKSAVESAHPYTPYSLQFMKTVGFRNNPPEAEQFTVVVCVFDHCGLALKALHHVRMIQEPVVIPVSVTQTARRFPSTSIFEPNQYRIG